MVFFNTFLVNPKFSLLVYILGIFFYTCVPYLTFVSTYCLLWRSYSWLIVILLSTFGST